MECSVVCFSKIKQTPDLRIDAEYWRLSFIRNSQLVSEGKKIKDFIVLDISNIKRFPINTDFEYLEISRISLNSLLYNTIRVKEEEEPDRAHYILKKNDVVVSTVRPNRNAVAFIDRHGVIGSSGLTVLRAKNIEPEYLFAFCKTDYFIKGLMRANKATMYPAVSKGDILDMPLFVPSKNFRRIIVANTQKAFSHVSKSNDMFKQAQSLLLSELGLIDWRPKHRLTFTKQYSDVKPSGRMDAEYFQPKYEELINKIKNYKGGWSKLECLVNMKKGVEVGSKQYLEEGIPFVRVSNITPFEITEDKYVSKQVYFKKQEYQPKEKEILFTKDATPGVAYYFQSQSKKMIISSGVLRLSIQTNEVSSDYLTLALNSILIKEQMNRDVGGSVILHWRPTNTKGVDTYFATKTTKLYSKKNHSLYRPI